MYTLFMVPTSAVFANEGNTYSVLWSHIGILKHRRRTFIPLLVSAKSWATAFLLAIAACSIFVFYCFPFRSIFLLVGIVGLGSSDK